VKLSPEYPICTERLRLRPLRERDVAALLAYRSLPEVCRYVPFEPMDEAGVRARLAGIWAPAAITQEHEALTLGVELADSGELVGDIVLFFRSEEHRSGEIGWILNPRFGGHGFATEAARAGLRLMFEGLGLHRVVARIDARNAPSLRLAARLGMRQEAHLVANEWFKGGWSDEIDFAMLESEWASR
jgi:RimJ/RimL family protein N-acetyltransferase